MVLKFNPADPENVNELNAFRLAYDIGPEVRLLGGYSGQLNNSDDRVELQRAVASGTDVTRVQEDEVLYDDLKPWPINADGTGRTIQRISATHYGNAGASWYSGPGTPGVVPDRIAGDMDGNGVVDAEDINAMFVQMRSATPDLDFDLNGDGLVDETDRDLLVKREMGIYYGDANFDGYFDSADLIEVLAANEYEDDISGNSIWQTGDWDGDGDFTTLDMILALADGGYEKGAQASPARADSIEAAADELAAALLKDRRGRA